MIEKLITFIVAFAATNIDDLFILTLFYASARYSHTQIVVGQMLGIFVLVGVSLLLSMLGNFFAPQYIGLLGLFPIYLGVRQVIQLFRGSKDEEENLPAATGVVTLALVTMANGGDNVGVYVPMLLKLSVTETIMLFMVFAVMVLIWCYAARYLAHHPVLKKSLDKYAHVLMPVVLIGLGVFILWESGVIETLFE